MSDAAQPTLEYLRPTVKPGVPFGTRIVEISPSPVNAVTVTNAVMSVPELVMNALDPLITQESPSSRAVVRMPPGMSDPPPGSVSPKPASRSPEVSGGSHRSFCSADPNR